MKNEKKYMIPIILLSVVVLSLIGYLVYDKVQITNHEREQVSNNNHVSNDEKNEEETSNIEIINEINNKIVAEELYSYLTPNDGCRSLTWEDGEYKDKKIIEKNEIDNGTKLALVVNYLREKDNVRFTDTTNGRYYSIGISHIKNAYEDLFDEEATLVDQFEAEAESVTLVKNEKNYLYEGTSRGSINCAPDNLPIAVFYDYKVEKEYFNLYVKYAYMTEGGDGPDGYTYYTDSNGKKIEGATNENRRVDEWETYKYSFRAKDGRYIFEKVEKIDYKK